MIRIHSRWDSTGVDVVAEAGKLKVYTMIPSTTVGTVSKNTHENLTQAKFQLREGN